MSPPHITQDEGSFPLLVDDWGAIEEVLYWMQWNMTALGTGMSIVCGSPLPPSILLPLPPYREDIAAHVVTKTARGKIAVYSLDLSRVTALVCPV